LAAAVLTAALGKRVLRGQSHWPTVLGLLASLAAAAMLVGRVAAPARDTDIGREEVVTLWTWADIAGAAPQPSMEGASPAAELGSGALRIAVVLRADGLTAVMLAMVTFIALLIAVYSIGYMRGDPGYARFFAYIPLFVFSMTMLVSVSNFLLLYVFWEAVGLCSYLLIGFWFERPAAAAAGKKAFLVNRVGDFGFALAIFLIWLTYGTLDFHDTLADGQLFPGVLGQRLLSDPFLYVGGGVGTAIALLLMAGACGKSAQFPLHVWLPDAMEGPTPVSALIHAATMVTAGVYLVARCAPLFVVSAAAQQTVAVVGGFTALLAALIALTQTDLKRVLAYSTISQLGYMFLALGTASLAGITAGMFHLFTHAFFKALLFLGAGSVMHAMGGVIDLRELGGLRRRMPVTHWTFLAGCLALAGIVPFAGFFSKDQILLAVSEKAAVGGGAGWLYFALYAAALLTAGLTACYTFRAFFLAFYGPERIPAAAGHHAHESPAVMTVPLAILAACALVVGAYFEWTHQFADFLRLTPSLAYENLPAEHHAGASAAHWRVAVVSSLVALAGIALAIVLYRGERRRVERLTGIARRLGLYQLLHGKFFFDEIYRWLIVAPLRVAAWAAAVFDRVAIDGLVDLCGWLAALAGAMLRPLQNGLIQFYALAMVLGVLILIGALLM
jgi:NADH-quinone oxidoreductase subunit L